MKKEKQYSKVYWTVKQEWLWAFRLLAHTIGKKESNVSKTLRTGRLSLRNQKIYLKGINKAFNRDYTMKDIFPEKNTIQEHQ